MILTVFGARVGRGAHVYPTVKITMPWNLTIGDHAAIGDGVKIYALGAVEIGDRSVVSQYAHLCAGSHDWRRSDMPLVKAGITVGDDVWVCAEAFIGPSVSIGDKAIIGARAVVTKDVDDNLIVAGNPARVIRHRSPTTGGQ